MAAYTVYIGGSLVTSIAGTLNVVNQIGQRSTGSFQCISARGVRWLYGTQVQIYDDLGALAYSGYVSKDTAVFASGMQAGTGVLEHTITLMDNCYRADKRLAQGAYLNATAGYIVTDLYNRILSAEGVTITASSIGAGAQISQVVWNKNKSVADALTFLAKQSGYWWNIDRNGVLWFQPYTGVPSTFIADGTTMDSMHNLTVDYGNDIYVNTETVKGSYTEVGTVASPLVETLYGDGAKRSFTLPYQISALVSVVLTQNGNTTNITSQMGTKGSTGNPFYYQVGDPIIAQDPSGTVLRGKDSIYGADYLTVTYRGRTPVLATASNATLIAAQKSREGTGTGIVEARYTNTKLRTQQMALSVAQAQLASYGQDITVLTFDVLASKARGLAEGQSIVANLPDFDLNSLTMIVKSVGIDDQTDGYNIRYHVTAVGGASGGTVTATDWQTYFQNLSGQADNDPSDSSDVEDGTTLSLGGSEAVSMAVTSAETGNKYTCFVFGNSTFFGNSLTIC